METEADIEQLVRQLGDYRTRARARQSLRRLGRAAVPRLLAALDDPQPKPNTRWAVVTLLGESGCAVAVPALLRILADDPGLRGEANRALMALTGKTDMTEDAEEWAAALGQQTEAAAPSPPGTEAHERPELSLVRSAVGDFSTQIDWEPAGYVYVRLAVGAGRKQQVLVDFGERDGQGRPAVGVYTECGPASPAAEEAISRRNVTLACGRFLVEPADGGGTKVVMRHQVSRAEATPELLRQVILTIGREADEMEYELSQTDRI